VAAAAAVAAAMCWLRQRNCRAALASSAVERQ
jgi:hypothetical protein